MTDTVLAAPSLIRTKRKERLPKGFSYPIGAELMSTALRGVPQYSLAEIIFSWKDTFWASKYQSRLRELGSITVVDVDYSSRFDSWTIRIHAVPSAHNTRAREGLPAVLSVLSDRMKLTSIEPDSFRWSAEYDLASAHVTAHGSN
jgi:hypothetical protein